MSDYSAVRGPRPADPHPLRLAALTAVIAGVVLLAAAAFVLSYAGIHQIALRAGISPDLARLYPVTFDAMQVIAAAAALALRGAGWWPRAYAWFSLLLMFAALAVGDAFHAADVALPAEPTRVVVAVTPWVLLLLAFGLLLEMLRYFRRVRADGQAGRAAAAGHAALAPSAPSGENGSAGAGNDNAANPGQRAPVTWAAAGGAAEVRALPPALAGLDLLLGPRETDPAAMPGPTQGDGTAAGEYPGQAADRTAGHHPESVAYGEETGYVHPDSYRDHGGIPAAGGPAGHEGYAGPGDPGQPRPEEEPEPGPAGSVAATPAGMPQAGGPRPVAADLGKASPAAADAAAANPGETSPAAADVTAANPGETSPAAADVTAANPGGTKPAAASPAGAGPAERKPAAAGPAERTPVAASPAAIPAEGSPGDGTAQAGLAETQDSAARSDPAPPQPAPANPAGTLAQPGPAWSLRPPAADGAATQPPARAVMPLLERLHSTPAPPGE